MHKAPPVEANVVAQMLPALLEDFMPRHQIMTKVVGEFLSSQQPYPGLMADVMFKVSRACSTHLFACSFNWTLASKVFENLIRKEESDFITEWVLLSVGSVVQRSEYKAGWNSVVTAATLLGFAHFRTPLAMAVWSLNCLFVCSSLNGPIHAQYPYMYVCMLYAVTYYNGR